MTTGVEPAPLRPPLARASSRPAPKRWRRRGFSRWRFVQAYATTFRVIGSYVWLSWTQRFFSAESRQQRLLDAHKRNARLVERTILELQGLFIKVGQLLSILANFLPDAFRAELAGLQDQVPPRPFDEIGPRIEAELERSLPEVFATLDEVPLASASLGQVHEGRLHDGTRVVVKVQHQNIDEIVRLDLAMIRRILGIVQWFVPVKGLDGYYREIKELLQRELDFALEAENILRISKNFTGDARVRFPTPIEGLWTRRVLVQTYCPGVKISDAPAIREMGIDRKDLAARLVRAFCQMIFVDGVYHADPHPGNVLVDAEGNLVLLDFGACAELSRDMREGIPEFLEGVIRRDTDRLIRALHKMGFLSKSGDTAVTERVIQHFHKRFQEEVKLESFNLRDVKFDPERGLQNVLDLRRMDVGLKELSENFHIPRDWVLLERTILLVYGSCAQLDPDLEPMGILQPYLQEFVLGGRDWQTVAVETVKDMALRAVALPDELQKYLVRASRGELEVRVRGVAEGTRAVYAVGRQLGYLVLALGAGAGALRLHELGDDRLARWPLGVSGAALLAYVVSSWRGRPRVR